MKKVILGYNNNEDFLIEEKSEKDKKISEILETIKEKEEARRREFEKLNDLLCCTGAACPRMELKDKSEEIKIEEPPKQNSASKFFKSLGNSIKELFTKKNKTVNINNIKKEEEEEKIIDVNKIINQQNFVEGYWELNENTEIIKQQYEKQFKLLKNENYDDNIVLTILIIYYIYKEHSELLKELIHIIQKGKNYIQKKARKSYDDIIKMVKI